LQSYISIFQLSPVDITNRYRNDYPKFLKFLKSSITFPSASSPKKNTAKIAKINRHSIRSRKTLNKAPTERVIVCIRA